MEMWCAVCMVVMWCAVCMVVMCRVCSVHGGDVVCSVHGGDVVCSVHGGDVVCSVHGGDVVPGLMFADETVLVASDEDVLRNSLDSLVEWCVEWGGGGGEDQCIQVGHYAH